MLCYCVPSHRQNPKQAAKALAATPCCICWDSYLPGCVKKTSCFCPKPTALLVPCCKPSLPSLIEGFSIFLPLLLTASSLPLAGAQQTAH